MGGGAPLERHQWVKLLSFNHAGVWQLECISMDRKGGARTHPQQHHPVKFLHTPRNFDWPPEAHSTKRHDHIWSKYTNLTHSQHLGKASNVGVCEKVKRMCNWACEQQAQLEPASLISGGFRGVRQNPHNGFTHSILWTYIPHYSPYILVETGFANNTEEVKS